MTDKITICDGIMDAAYDFFDPKFFLFDEDFVLATWEPFTIERRGLKADIEAQKIVECTSFDTLKLPDGCSWIIIKTFLPYEKPLEKQDRTNIHDLLGNSPQWLTWRDMY